MVIWRMGSGQSSWIAGPRPQTIMKSLYSTSQPWFSGDRHLNTYKSGQGIVHSH